MSEQANHIDKVVKALRAGHQYSGIVDPVDTAAADLIETLCRQLADAEATLFKLNSGEKLQSLMKLNNELRSQLESVQWQPIETAPRDGTHILACRIPVGIRVTINTNPPTVVHWFDDGVVSGFYTSVNEIEPEYPFNPTHWQPLNPLPSPSKSALSDEVGKCPPLMLSALNELPTMNQKQMTPNDLAKLKRQLLHIDPLTNPFGAVNAMADAFTAIEVASRKARHLET